MTAEIEGRREYYRQRIKAAEEAAANATDPETIEGWKQVANGYAMLLSRLPVMGDSKA
ncbi:MAG TPA: hypothetical protein VN718_08775 [Rhizomicrobium sp.]|nr:hypothetical protein [Rhizomicrobium sp.]